MGKVRKTELNEEGGCLDNGVELLQIEIEIGTPSLSVHY